MASARVVVVVAAAAADAAAAVVVTKVILQALCTPNLVKLAIVACVADVTHP